jgi:hypothetical protein
MNLTFRVVHERAGDVLATPWRADVGRYLVDHWYEVADLTVVEQRGNHALYVPARTWYGAVA